MPPIINFSIAIWDTSTSDLCPPGETPAWRWKVTIWREGMIGRQLYKEGCEDSLVVAAALAQAAVNTYGIEN